ncbi:hypothetical protein [Pseudidiomarina sp. CB1]|uniref:hypothetical protein n=1 Tax=Pseudidiomarina sp. CB1 TaxID=2972484 RepID=UPI0021624156|nr:hypothetical protein [Pseudidiomarina sp. CB1]
MIKFILVFSLIIFCTTFAAATPMLEQEQTCPANATFNVVTWSCLCKPGYGAENGDCVKIKAPENAHLSLYGSSWACNKGFVKEGDSCVAVKLPKNADFIVGGQWECNTGYIRVDMSCKEMTRPQLVDELKSTHELLMFSLLTSRRNCASTVERCEDECDKRFNYTDERKCLEICEVLEDECK